MTTPFFDSSKIIANDFLQSIIFIDDRAFLKEHTEDLNQKQHDFDSLKITNAFAEKQKICAVYNPKTLKDIDNLAIIAKKADITVIDWQINLEPVAIAKDKEEEDADNDDTRGPHTLKIIKEILSDPLMGRGSLKLILVYTGEIDLPGITKTIFDELSTQNIQGLKEGDCEVFTENIKILVVAKPEIDGVHDSKFKYNKELQSKIQRYEDLPDFILNEFSSMTSGLLSNFVLRSMTVLRNNTFRLIKLYNKELDAAFITHRIMLPNQDDSVSLLIEMLSNSIEALLNYNQTNNSISKEDIGNWIETREFGEKILIANREFVVDKDFVRDCLNDSFISSIKKRWGDEISGKKEIEIKKDYEKLFKNFPYLFRSDGDTSNINEFFSILSHHKSHLKQPSAIPFLSLGSIIKQINTERYFVCLQAKCDSVRISEPRKFMFLPLELVKEGQSFNIVVDENDTLFKLKLIKSSYDIRTIIFKPTQENSTIVGVLEDPDYIFISTHGEKYKWVSDLKDAHAQRIANNYAAQVSRVGLDESEWLRRWSNNN
ncbi:hypothetical protein FFJ24_007950 [Pedobacter sp. KBS0701]|uniref:response regulator receiver domain n=1 Tax=Pedobacter sp. KBS0701 TaxID=2578106 RepID=UPI00110E7B5C|nr:response regulator receiver domain [Pedobacter sp. KBS0701]QDW24751.1 hypothetical protein FFJ24_007950 [Pedobacter sp. KBS0701]